MEMLQESDAPRAWLFGCETLPPMHFEFTVSVQGDLEGLARGDLVILAKLGEDGFLQGWGRVQELTETDRQPQRPGGPPMRSVRVNVLVEGSGAELSPLDVRFTGLLAPGHRAYAAFGDTGFRLSPWEASHLGSAVHVPAAMLARLREHEAVAELQGEALRVLNLMVVEMGLGALDPELADALLLAIAPNPNGQARLTLGGVWTGLAALARRSTVLPPESKRIGLVQALGALLKRNSELDAKFRRGTVRDAGASDPFSAGYAEVTATSHATQVLRRAAEWAPVHFESSRVNPEAALAAMLQFEGSRPGTFLMSSGIAPDDFRAGLLSEWLLLDRAVAHRWAVGLAGALQTPIERILPSGASPDSISSNPPESMESAVGVAGLGNDDPWAEGLEDRLGAEDEARAFARLIASRALKPPMAVGVFGDWGAGKSFFMKLVHQHVGALAHGTAPEADSAVYHDKIVQIRFNAWHYVDTHLWASLVNHIFTELDAWARRREQGEGADRLFEQLATARALTLESAEALLKSRAERRDAETALQAAKEAHASARHKAAGELGVRWTAISKALVGSLDDAERAELASVADALGIKALATDSQALQQALGQLRDSRERGHLQTSALVRQLGSWPLVLALGLGCLALPVLLTLSREALAQLPLTRFVGAIHDTLLHAAGLISAAASVLALASARVRRALERMAHLQPRLEEAMAAATVQSAQAHEAEAQKLAAAQTTVQACERKLAAADAQLGQAERAYHDNTGRTRLLSFVRERAQGPTYSQHLGLVAAIRKDFEELSQRMASAAQLDDGSAWRAQQAFQKRVEQLIAQAPSLLNDAEQLKLKRAAQPFDEGADLHFERIVLYIDDLDRCQPDKVVEVLQAVHLLLSFPLFVVMLAVDVRWVSQALVAHYQRMLRSPQSDLAGPASQAVASSLDYLEKIIQVPYWVRKMSEQAGLAIVAERLKAGGQGAVGSSRATTADLQGPDADSQRALAGAVGRANSVAAIGGTVEPNRSTSPGSTDPAAPEASMEPPQPDLAGGALTQDLARAALRRTPSNHAVLTEPECAFISRLAPHVARSPRQALRFVNVCCLVKASFAEAPGQALKSGAYEGLYATIAAVTAAPALSSAWLAHLATAAANLPLLDASEDWARSLAPQHHGEELARLLCIVDELAKSPAAPEPQIICQHAQLAARYSFNGPAALSERSSRLRRLGAHSGPLSPHLPA